MKKTFEKTFENEQPLSCQHQVTAGHCRHRCHLSYLTTEGEQNSLSEVQSQAVERIDWDYRQTPFSKGSSKWVLGELKGRHHIYTATTTMQPLS